MEEIIFSAQFVGNLRKNVSEMFSVSFKDLKFLKMNYCFSELNYF